MFAFSIKKQWKFAGLALSVSIVIALLLVFLLLAGKPDGVLAQDGQSFGKTQSASFALLATKVPQKWHDAQVRWAGLKIDLASGAKTYWRAPGETGVPPSFDWSKSKNIKKIKVLWPAPHRFKEADSMAIGYDASVTLPIKITPININQPVELALGLFIGVCTEICIPVQQKLVFTLPVTTKNAMSLEEIMQTVPQKLEIKQAASFIKSLKIVKAAKPYLQIEAIFPKQSAGHDLLVEASEDFYLPLSKVMSVTASTTGKTYSIDLSDSDDPKALIGQPLKITLLSDKGNFEINKVLKH